MHMVIAFVCSIKPMQPGHVLSQNQFGPSLLILLILLIVSILVRVLSLGQKKSGTV